LTSCEDSLLAPGRHRVEPLVKGVCQKAFVPVPNPKHGVFVCVPPRSRFRLLGSTHTRHHLHSWFAVWRNLDLNLSPSTTSVLFYMRLRCGTSEHIAF
jgi:hypothetical protein